MHFAGPAARSLCHPACCVLAPPVAWCPQQVAQQQVVEGVRSSACPIACLSPWYSIARFKCCRVELSTACISRANFATARWQYAHVLTHSDCAVFARPQTGRCATARHPPISRRRWRASAATTRPTWSAPTSTSQASRPRTSPMTCATSSHGCAGNTLDTAAVRPSSRSLLHPADVTSLTNVLSLSPCIS